VRWPLPLPSPGRLINSTTPRDYNESPGAQAGMPIARGKATRLARIHVREQFGEFGEIVSLAGELFDQALGRPLERIAARRSPAC